MAIERSVYGKHRGKVLNSQDSQGLGRLLVTVPSVMGEAEIWALPNFPYAGPGVGMAFIPPKDANVWVEFEGNDPSKPIWSGCFWPETATDPNQKKVIETQASTSHIIKTNTMTMTVDDTKGVKIAVGEMEVSLSEGTVTVKSGGSEITITSSDINAKASSKFAVDGSDLELKGSQGKLDVKQVELKGSKAMIDASNITLKGSNVKIDGSDVAIDGSINMNKGNLTVD